MASAEEVVAMLDEQGVDKAVVCGFPWSTLSICKMNNEYVIDAVSRYPDRLLGLGVSIR